MTDTAGGIASAILDRFSEKRAPTENEYLGENGLLYCSKCHTPVQCRVNMFGTPKIVSCVCKCRREEEEKRKAQERELEHQRRISQLKANGIQEKHLLDWRFEVAEDNRDIQMARRYVDNWSEVSTPALTPDGNLTLIDDVGSSTKAGKQFITLVTKSGNYFYMVIDRDDKGEENVHFMNLVDEADLFALMDEDQVAEYQAAMDAQKEDETVEVTEPEPEDPQEIEVEKPEKKVNWAPLMLLAIVGVGGAGVFEYTALNKKKQEKVAARPDPDADYEDEDDEEYIIPDDDLSDEAEMSEDFEDDEN